MATCVPFILLLAAVLGLWMHRAVWVGALVAAIIAAYFTGALQDFAALWIAILVALALSYQRARGRASQNRRAWQTLAVLVFLLYALAMGFALLPGFNRVELVAPVVLSTGAT